ILRLFIEEHKDWIEMPDEDGFTPLMLAKLLGKKTAYELLIKAGAKTDGLNEIGKSIFHLTNEKQRSDSLQLFIKNCKELINKPDKEGNAPLHLAAKCGDLKACRILVESLSSGKTGGSGGAGSIVEILGEQGRNVLHLAAMRGHANVIQFFLGKYKQYLLDIPDREGNTPLHLAAKYGHLEACLILLKNKADTEAVNLRGQTAFELAILDNHPKVVKLFIENNESLLSKKDEQKNTPLHLAAGRGHLEVCQILLDFSPGAKTKGSGGAKGIDIGLENSNGQNVLHLAAIGGHTKMIQFFLAKYRQFFNVGDRELNTPFHLAAKHDHAEMYQILLKTGLRWEAKNSGGLTPSELF
ncbi:MAG TPA: ankyrin repeat domain-containing protein, partial [Chlamydiales bacterium]